VKSPSFSEFQAIIQFLDEELVGSQLQEVYSTEDGIVLGFYRFTHHPKTVWLVFDLDSLFPFVGMYDVNPWVKTKKTKPLALFLNSHFKNNYLKKMSLVENFGRVALFDFGTPALKLELELRLIPKQPNLIAYALGKKISWDKEKDLQELSKDSSVTLESDNRSIPYMFQQWLQRRSKLVSHSTFAETSSAQKSPYEKWVIQRKKDLQKKQKAIDQISSQNVELLSIPWAEIGDHLKTYGYKDLPLEWSSYVIFENRVSDNIQRCFEKAKTTQNKIAGSELRLRQIYSEIDKIQDTSEQAFQQYLAQLSISRNDHQLERKVKDVQFRRLSIGTDRQINVLMGKSASENVKLLRQSKAWDLWLHLKDYPSAYAIMQKNRDKSVSDSQLISASQWLIRETFKNKKDITGLKFAVVVAECRFVRPIKGDRLGRVTYHNPRELLISV